MAVPASPSPAAPQVPPPPNRPPATRKLVKRTASATPPPLPTTSVPTRVELTPNLVEPLPPAASWKQRLRSAPGWLTSAVVHLFALLVLAWWTVSERQVASTLITIQGSAADSANALEDQFEWTQEIESSTTASVDAPEGTYVGPQEAGSPILDSAVGSESSVALDGMTGSSISQIAALFVPGGGAMRSSSNEIIKKEAMFYGVKARGNRFVFIVDSSNSMRGNKFVEAKRELIYAIRRLGKDQHFYVIFFDANAERMVLDPDPNFPSEPAPAPVPATGENMLKVERWIGTVKNELKTNPYDAVKFAMGLSPDAIFLLTDGQFTDRGKTERYLASENYFKDDLGRRQVKVVFNTIGFYSRDGEEVLKEIAKKYKGTYQFVAPPKKG